MVVGVITISDTRCFDDDLTGQAVTEALRGFGFERFQTVIIADEEAQIKQAIRQFSATCDLVLTTGGTGFSPRDKTPEATASVLDRRADCLMELIRCTSGEAPGPYLSRGVAGTIGNALIVNLPGSPASARRAIVALGAVLIDVIAQMRGDEKAVVDC